MAGTPEDQDREASEQDQYQESTVCHDCLYRYQGDCRHSHGPLVPNKGVCGGKVLVQAKAPASLPINAGAEPREASASGNLLGHNTKDYEC